MTIAMENIRSVLTINKIMPFDLVLLSLLDVATTTRW